MLVVRISAGESREEVKNTKKQEYKGKIPGRVDICTIFDEQPDDEIVASRTCSVNWKYTVEHRIDRLAMGECVRYEADISSGSGGMKA